ncbi:MAG: glycosyltransferase family 9 protein [Bacteroidota bacterium]|nr:glycosyltransferase family 9 protein [Bacteroidota bacterium]
MSEPLRILVVRTDRIGDVVLTLPMVDILKLNHPDAYIAMMVRRYTSELVQNSTSVDETILYDDTNGLVPFCKMLKILRRHKFDVAFIAFPRFRIALLLFLAGVKFRVGSGYRLYSLLFNKRIFEHRKDAKKHELEYNLSLLDAVGISLKKVEQPWIMVGEELARNVKQRLENIGINSSDKIVIIHPGSGGSSRDWGIEKFAELGKKISVLQDVKIVITGGLNEHQLVENLKRAIGGNVVGKAGEFSLLEFAALAKLAELFISNSTGTIHIAAAVGTNVIGFYPQITALSPQRWGPYTEKKKVFTPSGKPADCNKCKNGKIRCECMDTISADEVFEAAKNFLNQQNKRIGK